MEADTSKVKAKPKKERIEHVPPEVTSREVTAEEAPKVAVDMAKLAEGEGWDVTITYARGTTDSAQPKVVDSIAVRMRRGPQAAAAVWIRPVVGGAWKFDMGARAGRWLCQKTGMAGLIPIKLGNAAMKEYLRTPLPVANADLPADIWSAGAGDLDPEMMEGLARLASLFAGDESRDA